MLTLPRLCLVDFGDYKQKDGDVNAMCCLIPHQNREDDMDIYKVSNVDDMVFLLIPN